MKNDLEFALNFMKNKIFYVFFTLFPTLPVIEHDHIFRMLRRAAEGFKLFSFADSAMGSIMSLHGQRQDDSQGGMPRIEMRVKAVVLFSLGKMVRAPDLPPPVLARTALKRTCPIAWIVKASSLRLRKNEAH